MPSGGGGRVVPQSHQPQPLLYRGTPHGTGAVSAAAATD
eukprot:CAMPEP_0196659812 /NCGR_PEP_ID=MMETSP1086-20130531/36677_1 /TAXON_ID=77921 /ORGANISM="Cyanoptyche  gloeocystis , Strain SAG4.97" /LENGTH=38 /DNA_ID= /DNA_START= /DNA_END= /DNA_ORIENTATION=